MTGEYIPANDAAQFENLEYNTFMRRVYRNPDKYNTRQEPRENGGKPYVMICVNSLSRGAQQRYMQSLPDVLTDAFIKQQTQEKETPWYVTVDFNWFVTNHRAEYDSALKLMAEIRPLLASNATERAEGLRRLADLTGIPERTMYRHAQAMREAEGWALKMQLEDGFGRTGAFQAMAICRKPRKTNTFPSILPEQRNAITQIWFKEGFVENDPTKELAYQLFKEAALENGWESIPSGKTFGRYIDFIMSDPLNEHAHYLAAHGIRKYRNVKLQKCRRNTKALDALEFVQGDEHTFDLWVSVTEKDGTLRAIRPKLVAWIDTRTRVIMGDLLCENPNAMILKQSIAKMVYSNPGGVPKHLHIDNGRDYTAQTNTGQSRKDRQMNQADFDSEIYGFYRQVGIEKWSRSLPYQPWSKAQIERFFRRVCEQFSKRYPSYVGTLTGSKTEAKRQKDINGMLKRGELLTIEQFYDEWTYWLREHYHKSLHRGLQDANEEYMTPFSCFENAMKYQAALPPREQVAYMLMETATAYVHNGGINKFNTLYTGAELCYYVGKTVNIRWDTNDITRLHVFAQDGTKIGVALSYELMSFGECVTQDALETHIRNQRRQEGSSRGRLYALRVGMDERLDGQDETPKVIGGINLSIAGSGQNERFVRIPNDKEYRSEVKHRVKTAAKREYSEYFLERGRKVFEEIQAQEAANS